MANQDEQIDNEKTIIYFRTFISAVFSFGMWKNLRCSTTMQQVRYMRENGKQYVTLSFIFP